MEPLLVEDQPLQDRRYLLLARIGRGGMADVYRAFDRFAEQPVALKVPRENRPASPAHPLAAEYERWARLDHPSIVRVRELAVAASGPLRRGIPYLVLDHVPGGTLYRALHPGRIPYPELHELARQLLAALACLHRGGLVHRDVKPANVLCETAGGMVRFKLTDFGLASPSGRRGAPGRVSGSLPFVAPEGLLGDPVDGRADLYGLGVLLFEMATGRRPSGDTVAEVLRWHLAGGPADPGRLRPRLPRRFRRLVRRLTERDPDRRPPDGERALEALGSLGVTPATAPGSSAPN